MPKYSDERILKAIDGCRGYITVIARRLGCRRGTISDRLKKNKVLAAAMEEELDKKGDDAEMLLEQMMSEKIPVVIKRLSRDKKGKNVIIEEQKMVFSKAATPALIFFLKTKCKDRGYAESRWDKDGGENPGATDEALNKIADAMQVK